MTIQLSDHFSFGRLLRFAIPSILMMSFSSIYGVVDGYFISNFVGKTSFASVNFIMPFIMVLTALGFMVGAGGSALVGMFLGMGNRERANRIFSMLVYLLFAAGVTIALVGVFVMKPVVILLGADESMVEGSVLYGRACMIGLPFMMLQLYFQNFFVVAERPKIGLYVTLASGIMNMLLDGLFVGVFSWGVLGAAAATVSSQIVGGGIPLIYFFSKNTSPLHLGRTNLDVRALGHTLANGSSEFISQVSMSLVGMLYNAQLMKFAGQNGVSAYGVIMYVGFIFISIYIGYSVGTAPIVSFHYGAGNKDELKNLYRKSLFIIISFSLGMLLLSFALSKTLAQLYVGYDEELMLLTLRSFRIYSLCFLFSSIPIYGSSFFTALNDGLTSGFISFLRTVVLQVVSVLLFPLIFGVDGIWYSLVFAELVAALVTIILWVVKRKKYGYM